MRLGISSQLKHSSPEEWARQQAELGCRAVVFPVQSNEPEEKIDAYKRAADEHGLLIAEVGIWRNALASDPVERAENRDYCVAQLKMADRIGARCAVNVAGAFGPIWDGGYHENFSVEARKKTVEMIREIIDRAEVKRTYFTIEPMPWMIPTGTLDYMWLMEEVDRDKFAVHMDIINMVNSMQRYFEAEELINDCANLIGRSIRSCHIKDVHLKREYTLQLEECPPGCGEFPLKYYVKKMHELDPDMPIILEHLKTDEEYLKYFEYLKGELNGI